MAVTSNRRARVFTVAFLLMLASSTAARAATDQVPLIGLAAPSHASAGQRVVLGGSLSEAEENGRVLVQMRSGGDWKGLARGDLREKRFRAVVRFAKPGTRALRAVLLAGRRQIAVSPVRRLRVLAVTAAPVAPTLPPVTSAVAPAPAPAPAPPAPLPPVPTPPESASYWGAWIGPQFTGTPAPEDMSAVTKFEALSRKPLSILETFSSWKSCPTRECDGFVPFPRQLFDKMRGYGAIPLYSWASEGSDPPPKAPEFQLEDIIRGDYDGYVRRWAEEAKTWRHPFFLRFDWEMNGKWWPWDESANENRPGEFVTAWRHVHDIFTQVGATNATWVWCPYINPAGKLTDSAELYPGDAYVDWTCIDGYNFGTSEPESKWKSVGEVFSRDYSQIATQIAPSKPMLLGEVASVEVGGSKADWIRELFARLPVDYPAVRAFLWFDYYDQGRKWPIETSASATEAFAAGIASPRYLGNSFGALGGA